MKGLAAVLLLALAVTAVAAEQGPYEDIQGLLASASASANGLRALDSRGAPRVVTVVHNHAHVVPHDMPRRVAQRIAEAATPAPKPVRIVAMPNRAQAARHAAEDAQYARDVAQPAVHKLNVKTTLHGMVPPSPHPAGKMPSGPSRYTIRGVKSPAGPPAVKVNGKGYHFPLVDRRLQKPTFSVVADLDGSDAAGGAGAFKAHTAADLQAEAAKLLARAQALKEKRSEREAKAAAKKAENAKLGIFTEKKDAGYEDEITRMKRASARINRLQEQIETPHNEDSFEASIARKKYFLKIYAQLKAEISQLVEDYALRTGNSIFTMFGNGKIDPSIAAFLPPNSVAGILSKYTNPTQDRDDETPRDVISGRDAKRIQYSIDYYKAKQARARLPMPPKLAPTDEELAKQEQFNNPALNKILATQSGEFGQGRPAITTGAQAIGRSSVHIAVVNPADTQKARGMPFQVNLKTKRVKKH